jgi:uncharacterized protein with von Willebrand factor type A (vWA) domain
MHPAELMSERGNINPRYTADTRGIDWLLRIREHFERSVWLNIREHFERSVWLNPSPAADWERTHTTGVIRSLFPMYSLTPDGIQDAVAALIGARASTPGGHTRH